MPSQSRPSRARAGAEDAADTSLERKTLLSLPPEILAHVVSFMGRTLSSPRPQPGALFRTCRDLYAVGTDTTTRIEFLLGTYGTESAVERVGTWLSLATREVLEGLFRRVGKVPRYQLQRLARRCVNASRSDLLLPIMAYGEEMYPAPSLRTVSLLGKPHAPPAGLGLSLTLTDEELFRIMANEDKVPGEVSYLVDEAVEGGWRVEGDSVMSAMLTLQKRYGFNPNFWLGVRVPLGQSGDNELRYSDRRTAHIFASDYGLEGVNGGHALLVTAIAANREPTVRRLLQLGVSTQGTSKDCFFWQAMEELCASLPLPSETEAEPSGYRSYGYADFDRGASKLISEYLGTPQVPDRYSYYSQYDGPLTTRPSKGAIIGALCRQFSSTSPYSEHSLFSDKARGDCTDALQVAIGRSAITANNDDRILRLLLRHLAESGWVGTEEGLKSLETCQAMCLKTDKLNFLNILQQYARENSGGGVVDGLVSALSAQDAVLAQQLVAEGMTMTDAQLVSRSIRDGR